MPVQWFGKTKCLLCTETKEKNTNQLTRSSTQGNRESKDFCSLILMCNLLSLRTPKTFSSIMHKGSKQLMPKKVDEPQKKVEEEEKRKVQVI